MKYEVWAIMQGNVNAAGKAKTACFGHYNAMQKAAAEKHAADLAKSGYYRRVRLVEIPSADDKKPYSRKTTIFCP